MAYARSASRTSALAWAAALLARSHASEDCHVREPASVTDIAHAGLCPASMLTCPACPIGRVHCPLGGCSDDIRDCAPNVNVRGACNGTHCDGVEWCHLYSDVAYACWEFVARSPVSAPSTGVALMRFNGLQPTECNYCTSVRLSQPCESCCGIQSRATWSGSHSRPGDEARQEGGIWMTGSKWVCLLREVAERLLLANAAAGISGSDAEAPPSPRAATTLALTEEEVLVQLDLLPEAV